MFYATQHIPENTYTPSSCYQETDSTCHYQWTAMAGRCNDGSTTPEQPAIIPDNADKPNYPPITDSSHLPFIPATSTTYLPISSRHSSSHKPEMSCYATKQAVLDSSPPYQPATADSTTSESTSFPHPAVSHTYHFVPQLSATLSNIPYHDEEQPQSSHQQPPAGYALHTTAGYPLHTTAAAHLTARPAVTPHPVSQSGIYLQPPSSTYYTPPVTSCMTHPIPHYTTDENLLPNSSRFPLNIPIPSLHSAKDPVPHPPFPYHLFQYPDQCQGGGKMKQKIKKRTEFSPADVKILEAAFAECDFARGAKRDELATTLGVPLRSITVWFQNKRAKLRNEKKRRDMLELAAKTGVVDADSGKH